MHPMARLVLAAVALQLMIGAADAGDFKTIGINKDNQRELSADRFAIQVEKGEQDCLLFTVHLKASVADVPIQSGLARLELAENDGRVSRIPVERRDKADGSQVIMFELTRELARKSTLALAQGTAEAGGNLYRINLSSYAEDGRRHEGVWEPSPRFSAEYGCRMRPSRPLR